MFRTIQRVVTVAAVVLIDGAAVVVAIHESRMASLLIGAAMVASSTVIFGRMVDRRLGDAYDTGKRRREPHTQEARRV